MSRFQWPGTLWMHFTQVRDNAQGGESLSRKIERATAAELAELDGLIAERLFRDEPYSLAVLDAAEDAFGARR